MNKPQIILDTECYRDYWLAMFQVPDGRTASFEMYPGKALEVDKLLAFLENPNFEIVTFNGIGYDMPMIGLALAGASNADLKEASDAIILTDLKPWDFARQYKVTAFDVDHVDLMQVAPGMAGLKIYGGRMHCQKLQDLPVDPGDSITPELRVQLRKYCNNDLELTRGLADTLREQIDLRRTMGAELKEDLRSKSDAQIAEVVLKNRIADRTGVIPRKWPISYTAFKYEPPAYIRFRSPTLRAALATMASARMVIKPDTGHVTMPPEIDALDIKIGTASYKIGIGGLHSQESEVSHYADEHTLLRDIDVRSYYPNLILNMGMYPDAMGPHFLVVYRDILTERLAAKDAKELVKDASLKIVANSTFGKTSNQYSTLYNPKLLIHTTLTGQLVLLMLIEMLEGFGIPVVSANTDGIVVKCPLDKEPLQRRIVSAWEKEVNLETEETNYLSIHARDVNSYIAVKVGGGVKTKGAFATGGLAKNPQNEICAEAVVKFIVDGAPVEGTVRNCTDIRKFLTLRKVQGGAFKEGYFLGKAIRWYYATDVDGVITYKTNGNTVPRSEGASPMMDLPETLPDNVDYDWYIRECTDMLMDVGLVPRPPVVKLPRKNSKAWKEMFPEKKTPDGLGPGKPLKETTLRVSARSPSSVR